MTTFATGRRAEETAANFLQIEGFKVLEQNFRTRWCEIDIVAQKQGVYYFVEVKYRRSDQQGSGLEYITVQKLRQMAFAASFWLQNHRLDSAYQLAGIEVGGEDFEIAEFIESLT